MSSSGEDNVSNSEDVEVDGSKSDGQNDKAEAEDGSQAANHSNRPSTPSPARSPLSQIIHQEELFKEELNGERDNVTTRRNADREAKGVRGENEYDESPSSTLDNPSETPSTPDDSPSRRV
jgi:hypothetical protein